MTLVGINFPSGFRQQAWVSRHVCSHLLDVSKLSGDAGWILIGLVGMSSAAALSIDHQLK
jgi:hypothetical protein